MFIFIGLLASVLLSATTEAKTRKLKIYYLHTGEKAIIAFKKNGKYLPAGLKKLNHFLRDWRRNEPTKMDPLLLDLVWEIYRQSGSKDYINVISGYRSPVTNNMLRKRGRGVARKSQHTLGKALDFFLPDVKLSKLRKIGLIKQVGGVGYYPRSGSPFVHIDTGSVRHWPRMTRKELVRVFPNGKTLHIPTDGKPLPGYNQAVAAYNTRQSASKKIALAKGSDKQRKSFFQRLANLVNDNDEDRSFNNVPTPRKVRTTSKPVSAKSVPASDIPNDMPPKPELPLIASVPVPRIAPRNSAQTPDNITSDNIAVARLDNQNENPALKENPAQERSAFNIPVPAIRPEFTPMLVAQADTIRQPVQPTNTNDNQPAPSKMRLASIASQQLRAQLIAQAKDQLRPTVAVGSSFKTALLPQQNSAPANNKPVLTRSLAPAVSATANPVGTRLIDKSLKSDGTIPVPRTNPNSVAPTQVAFLEPRPTGERLTNNGEIPLPEKNSAKPVNPAPIDSKLKNNGTIALPQPNPVEVAALSSSNSDEIDPVVFIPVWRPQLFAADSDTARNANLVLALVEGDAGKLASPENLRAMMEKQAQKLASINAANNDTPQTEDSISPIILAAIPTPSPRHSRVKQAPVSVSGDPASRETQIVIASLENASSDNSGNRPDAATLTSAPKPLDELSLAWYEQNRTGKFVLSASLTIEAADEMRAPAYGRAAIRQTPKTVLTAGFIPSGSIQNSSSFTGDAIRFQTFTKFN